MTGDHRCVELALAAYRLSTTKEVRLVEDSSVESR